MDPPAEASERDGVSASATGQGTGRGRSVHGRGWPSLSGQGLTWPCCQKGQEQLKQMGSCGGG